MAKKLWQPLRDKTDDFDWGGFFDGFGSSLKGVGAIGGALAASDSAWRDRNLKKKMLRGEQQRLNRDQKAHKNMIAAFGGSAEEQKAFEKEFNFA
ncbi:MAG: hypothetical protein LBN32_00385 [Helicobacteraceae bacterium]|jgi:hypothetical protein|nr:hypothetical protein [Helicobacteraceae bacterium]